MEHLSNVAINDNNDVVTAIDRDKRRIKEDLRLFDAIKWESIDKDNMEYKPYMTCYQVEALKRLVAWAEFSMIAMFGK